MYSIDCHVGRLIEVLVATPVALEEVEAFGKRLRVVVGPQAGKIIVCVDLRGARVFPPAVAEAFVGVMRGDNPRLERSAFLVSDSALFSLQVERMIREAGSPLRRTFREPADLAAWVADALTDDERA